MATRKRKNTRRSYKKRRGKSSKRKTKRSKRRKNYRMIKRKTITGSRLGGGGGNPTLYCKKCTEMINYYNMGNRSADKLADTIYYSDLLKIKDNCFRCLNKYKINKHKFTPSDKEKYRRALGQIVPIMENIQKAINIQKRQAKNPDKYYPMLEGLYNNMTRTRINKLTK